MMQSRSISNTEISACYLGAFGWLENVRPAKESVSAVLSGIPTDLHNPPLDGPLIEQRNNGGFIHGPSQNHAVTAAVLRNAYLTHVKSGKPDTMAVNLSSERVRNALSFLEGIRNGQELGALLGYQLERGLHDYQPEGGRRDLALGRYVPAFRKKYPMLADKITPTGGNGQLEPPQARLVLDGYALVEAVFLKRTSPNYPYGVDNLPRLNPTDPERERQLAQARIRAIRAEVERLNDTFDGIADLSLAEGIFQMTQGNFERAGAMMKALTEGGPLPEPEIASTPRSGVAITNRVALHLETLLQSQSTGPILRKAEMEPGLNKWLGDILPPLAKIQYRVRWGEAESDVKDFSISSLMIQPIDLVYIIGDQLANATTELESRIAYQTRIAQENDNLPVTIEFKASLQESGAVRLVELLPMLRSLRELVSGSRPLAADDFTRPPETTMATPDTTPKGYNLDDLKRRITAAYNGNDNNAFQRAVTTLSEAIAQAEGGQLRDALRTLADFGVPDAFPRSTFVFSEPDPEKLAAFQLRAKGILLDQALSVEKAAMQKRDKAEKQKGIGDNMTLTEAERVDGYRAAAQEIFGASFNLIPLFVLKNKEEVKAAVAFRDADPATNLTRHHNADKPYLVDEWLQGAAAVRDKIGRLNTITLFSETFQQPALILKPLQLPFDETDHWVAVEFPEFELAKNFLSIVQGLAKAEFKPDEPQSGLLIDEWIEVIPGLQETTGIALHYNQPNSEPPQALLLAVTPKVEGHWTWDKLVGILNDTLNRAKRRGVEPELLGSTAYGHMLPAILSAEAPDPKATPDVHAPRATIVTDFVQVKTEGDCIIIRE